MDQRGRGGAEHRAREAALPARAADDQVGLVLLGRGADASPRRHGRAHDGCGLQPDLARDPGPAIGDRLRRIGRGAFVVLRGRGDDGVGQRHASEVRPLHDERFAAHVDDDGRCLPE
jgi:hypothetical protein